MSETWSRNSGTGEGKRCRLTMGAGGLVIIVLSSQVNPTEPITSRCAYRWMRC